MPDIPPEHLPCAVVVPIFNGRLFVEACFAALLPQCAADCTVLAVENGSSDGSAELVAAYPGVMLITSAVPLGFAGAVNLGIRAALALPQRPATIVLLNQDTLVDPGWLAALLQPLADPRVGLVGSLARFPDGALQHAGAELLAPLWYGRNLTTLPAWARSRSVIPDAAPGAAQPFVSFLATALRVAMLDQIGLLDEGFRPAYFEDADLCLRAVAAGWQLAIAWEATLVHAEGARQSSYRHTARLERNRLRLLLTHRALPELQGEVLSAERAQLLRRANAGASQALRQAYLQALVELPAFARKRGWNADETRALAAGFAALRDLATDRERHTRLFGLHAANQLEAQPAAPAGVHARPTGIASQTRTQPASAAGAVLPPVAIVMLTWNGIDYTRACLDSIRKHSSEIAYQLIVVDNGSTDGTRAWLREQPDVTLIENESNVGFTAGNNQGMAAAPPEHDLLLLNNDTLITQHGWLARLREVAHSAPEHGIVGCMLLHSNGLLQHAGTYMPTHTYWGYQIGGGEEYVGQYPGVRDVEGITGACMYIRRDAYATIGALDPSYFSYFEDTDYCLRARQAGYRVVCVGDVQIVHHENTSSKINRSDWRAMFSAGQQIFQQHWHDVLEERYTRAVLWQSLVSAPTGYATSSREIIRELDRRDVDVRVACVFGTDYTEPPTRDPRIDQLLSRPKNMRLPQVVYSQGDAFVKNSGRYKIGFTMHEADGLPEDWVNQANQMDEVWTPTPWGAEAFMSSGVRRPVHVVPLGFNPDYFHPGIRARRASERFTFISVFDWIERKAPDLLIQAYLRAFQAGDDVLLVLKVSNSDPHFDVQRQLAELTGGAATPPIAVMLNQPIDAYQMGVLYRSADCFVLPTRGEGWGMPTLEAMACGLPVISTDWGAQTAFLRPDISYPLRVSGLVPAVARAPYYAGQQWAAPDIDHLCELIRYVYEHPHEGQALGARAAHDVHSRWTWAHAVDRIIARLDAIGAV